MRRRDLLKLGGLAALGTALGGCSDSSAHVTAATWEAIPSYSLQGTDPKRVGYLKKQLAAFTAGGRAIAPEVTSADTVAAMTKLLLQASQRRAPDVAQVDSYIFGRMSRFAQPLDDAMDRHGLVLDDWFPSIRTVMTGSGTGVRGLQFTTDVRVLYYRKDLVPRAPATWDELVSVMGRLSRQGYSFLFAAGRNEGSVLSMLWPQLWSQGAEIMTADGEPGFSTGAGYTAAANALGIVERCVRSGITPPAVSTFGSEDKANSDVVAGHVAMFIGGSWQAAVLNSAIKGEDFFSSWGAAALPSLTEQRATGAGGWVWATFTEDANKARTGTDWVVQAYVDDAGMAAWCTAGGYLPPRASIYQRPEYKQNPFTPLYRQELAVHAHTRPAYPKYLEISNTMQIALSSVASGSTAAAPALDAALNRLV